jgi:hypothetical protein
MNKKKLEVRKKKEINNKKKISIAYEETHKMIFTTKVLIPLMISFIPNTTNLFIQLF